MSDPLALIIFWALSPVPLVVVWMGVVGRAGREFRGGR